MKLNLRELRGLGIVALGGQIKKLNDTTFLVKSQSNNGASYTVEWKEDKWICNCQDYAKRGKHCKHIYAVNFLLDLPRIVLSNSEAFERLCPYCGSANIRPKGYRYNKNGPLRMFKCKDCNRRFGDTTGSEYNGAKAALAIIAADLYFKGLSLRDIKNHLWQVYGIDKSAATLHRWVTRIANALKRALENVKLDVGSKWLADETSVKVEGELMYLWNIMDYETRRYIVSLLTSGREAEDALKAIKQAIRNAGKLPRSIVTDGLKSYSKAVELLGLPVEHISNAGLAKYENNNRIERLHGTVKEWIKRRRGLKEEFNEFIESYRLYYNYIRPNNALKDKTPAKTKGKWFKILSKSKIA
ncbi:MAG: IS6 family transposase [Nitrososphaerota archaeon]|nr:IS6 family transposase [Nitrososphaerota archaeon]